MSDTDEEVLETCEDMAFRKSGFGTTDTFARAGTKVPLKAFGRCGPCEAGKHRQCKSQSCGCVCRTRTV